MNSLGRYDQAQAAAIEASEDTPELFVAMWSLSELIEAASRTGDTDVAAGALARLREHTQDSDSDWALGIEARGRALLAEVTRPRAFTAMRSSASGAPAPSGLRPCASALRGMAAARESPQ